MNGLNFKISIENKNLSFFRFTGRRMKILRLCNCDYYDPDYIQVARFKDRVEIRNPGKLFGDLTIDDLR